MKVAIDTSDLDMSGVDGAPNEVLKSCRDKTNLSTTGTDATESDSDATALEPASPLEDQATHVRAQGRDLRLCCAFNTFSKDRHTLLHV